MEHPIDIVEHYDEIAHCNKCGFCQTACPVFRATGHEAGVARGRLALLRAVIEERLDWTDQLEAPLYDCLLCGACTSNCFPAIPTSDLLIRARSQYLDRVGRKAVHRLLFDQLLPYPKRLHRAARAAALGKITGLSKLARALGLLRVFGRDFMDAEKIIDTLPLKAWRVKHRPGVYQGTGKTLSIGYFMGCGIDIVQPDSGTATLSLLRETAREVHVLENCCCGLPAWSFGDLGVARNLAVKNLEIMGAGHFDLIVTDCSSCASFLKKYPVVLDEQDGKGLSSEGILPEIKDLVEWLGTKETVRPRQREPFRVTYHDPCHASRGQGMTREPRGLLEKMPGIEYRELPEADWCCGGAGAYALSQFDLYRRVLDRKMDNLKKTGADIIATSCPACMIHLSYGIRRKKLKTRVCHISELLADNGSG